MEKFVLREKACGKDGWQQRMRITAYTAIYITYVRTTEIDVNDFPTITQVQVAVNTFR